MNTKNHSTFKLKKFLNAKNPLALLLKITRNLKSLNRSLNKKGEWGIYVNGRTKTKQF